MNRFSFFEALYRHSALGKSWSESMIAWGVELLGGTQDTPSLRILAGLSGDSPECEVREYFASALAELGVVGPSDNERMLGMVRFTAAEIARGEVRPVEGTARIHHVAVSPLNHPQVLQPWCDLDSGFRVRHNSPEVEKLEGDALDRAIIAFATEFASGDPADQLRLLEEDLSTGAI